MNSLMMFLGPRQLLGHHQLSTSPQRSGRRSAVANRDPSPEGHAAADLLGGGLGVGIEPGGVGIHLPVHHHVVVVGLTLPAADGAVAGGPEAVAAQRLRREVGVALHLDDVAALSDHLAIPARLHWCRGVRNHDHGESRAPSAWIPPPVAGEWRQGPDGMGAGSSQAAAAQPRRQAEQVSAIRHRLDEGAAQSGRLQAHISIHEEHPLTHHLLHDTAKAQFLPNQRSPVGRGPPSSSEKRAQLHFTRSHYPSD